MSVLVLLEHAEGAIKEASLSAVTAGAQLGDVTALVVGSGDQAAADRDRLEEGGHLERRVHRH